MTRSKRDEWAEHLARFRAATRPLTREAATVIALIFLNAKARREKKSA